MRPICRLSASSRLSLASAIWALVLCGFTFTAVPAHAADIAIPARSYYPPLPPAIYDWTGIYLGGHIGGGMLADSVSQNGTSTGGFNLGSTGNLRPAGVIGGFQGGANYEFAPWVIGIEGSWTDSAIKGSTLISCTGTCLNGPTTPVTQERFTSQAQWFAALTGRVGYAANNWLFYAKAGGAWMRVRYTEDLLTAGGVTGSTQVLNDDRSGFTVGAGIEFGLVENISAKVEYDFYDFGSKNYNFASITPVAVKSDVHTLTVGLNYRFNWSGGPKP